MAYEVSYLVLKVPLDSETLFCCGERKVIVSCSETPSGSEERGGTKPNGNRSYSWREGLSLLSLGKSFVELTEWSVTGDKAVAAVIGCGGS